LYVGKLANAYFYDNVIAGQTDFLYGFGTAFIEKTTLSLRGCGGGITAWKGANTTFANKYGVYIADSQVIAANSSIANAIKGKCSLGRPWNNLHRSIFMNTYLDSSILPAGYTVWKGAPNNNFINETMMAVYADYGPGYNQTAEENGNVTRILDRREVTPYARPVDVFMTPEGHRPNIAWLDPIAASTGRP
jgi:pectin methylesterase-like acyl-CoA thioesterase